MDDRLDDLIEDGGEDRRPDIAGLIDGIDLDIHGIPSDDVVLFLERIADDWGEYQAGMAAPLTWSPLKTRKFCEHPDIRDLIFAIHEIDHETIEHAVKRTARRGNPAAQKLWLINKAPHRGWADRKQVQVAGEIDTNIVVSVRQALEEQTRELVARNSVDGIARLQAAIGIGEMPEEDILEAEVVE